MTTTPVSPSPFHKVIKAVATVRTRGGFAAWNLLLIAMSFGSLLIFGANVTNNQMWMIIALFICWQAFAVFALLKLPKNGEGEKKTPPTPPISPRMKRRLS